MAQLFATSKLTTTGSIVGTPEYISPEQAEGKRATRRSDLYSLGVLIYTMLTGRPPFLGKTTLDVIQKHRYGRFDRLSALVPDIPRRLEQVVDQLLEKDPEKRFPDAYVLSLRLKEVLKRAERDEEATATHEGDLGYDYDGEAPTVAAGRPQGASGPGPATVMHNLMKAELDRTQQPTPFGRLFNSGWFLLACFALLVVGGVWWFRTQPLARVVQESMDEEPVAGEIDRLLELARHQQRLGDEARAERILSSLCTLLADDPKRQRQYRLAQRRLEQLRSRRAERTERDALLNDSLDRAVALAQQGQPEQAAALCRSLLELYRDDPTAADAVEKAAELLRQVTPSAEPPRGPE
ncbi:MAG TPA: hypothetical protein EYP14_02825 [Planctomycetaceae bacterium]|nr:hypothetical protein [Planctomycetaceae bacterium]